ncbi:MAG: large conductance mechanosensitive channel protein MscL [Actinomycetota bacterium]
MLKEFKAFILRGNVVDLAVGVVVGAAFGAIVNSLVKDLLTPLLGLVHIADFKEAFIGVGKHVVKGKVVYDAKITYGAFINSIISFVLISAAVFFFVVKPVNHLMALRKTQPDPASLKRDCPHCYSAIPMRARRCAFCTSEVEPAA